MKIRELLENTAADSFLRALEPTKSTPSSKLDTFTKDVKTGFSNTQNLTRKMSTSKPAKMARGFAKWAKDVNRGFRK